MNIFVFVTSIYKEKDKLNLKNLLQHYFRIKTIRFDFKDRKNILRIESPYQLQPEKVTSVLNELGYTCKELK